MRLFILSLLTSSIFAAQTLKMQIYEKGKFKDIEIYVKDAAFMNKKCFESEDCQKMKGKHEPSGGLSGHPGSEACKSIANSEYKILKRQNGNQIGFCRFADGSMKSARSLLSE